MTANPIKDLYLSVFACKRPECEMHCARNQADPEKHSGFVPRWFHTCEKKDILFIATNPGGLDNKTKAKYKEILSKGMDKEQAEALYDFQNNLIRELFSKRSDTFHGPIVDAFEKIFNKKWVKGENLLDCINFTNVVKCTTWLKTEGECKTARFSQVPGDDKIFLVEHCIERFLQKEIELLQPSLIILYNDRCSMDLLIKPKISEIPYVKSKNIPIVKFTRSTGTNKRIKQVELDEAISKLKNRVTM